MPGRLSLKRPSGGSSAGHRAAAEPRTSAAGTDAVYNWADDGWPDDAWADNGWADADAEADDAAAPAADRGAPPADAAAGDPAAGATAAGDPAAGGPAAGGPAGPAPGGPAAPSEVAGAAARAAQTDTELADQDEWDAELAADPQLAPDATQPGQPVPAGGPAHVVLGESSEVSDDGQGRAAVLRSRDDGTLARWFGRLVRGQLMPLPPALLALAGVAMLARLGLRDLPGLLILAPAIVMLVAAPGASHRHDGRFDWLVPAVLQGAQYVYIAALGFAAGVPVPITFVLCAAIALHYADRACAGSPILLAAARRPGTLAEGRPRAPRRPPRRSLQRHLSQQHRSRREPDPDQLDPDLQGRPGAARPWAGPPPGSAPPVPPRPAAELGSWMGWEGRMIACGLGAAMGIAMFAYLALAGYLGWLVCLKIRASYLGLREGAIR
jgi:hypothetical protein